MKINEIISAIIDDNYFKQLELKEISDKRVEYNERYVKVVLVNNSIELRHSATIAGLDRRFAPSQERYIKL
jgi:hypothetical protein